MTETPDSAPTAPTSSTTTTTPDASSSTRVASISAVVFDVGGVLLDWNPRYLYRSLLPDERSVERFLAEVCTPEWNAAQDAGRSWAEAVAELTARFPEHADLIRAYDERWAEMVAGALEDTVEVLSDLRAAGVPTYALTNFSAEKWQVSLERWEFLRALDGAVVSGVERVSKPAPEIYQLLLDRHDLAADQTFYTDDLAVNVTAARQVGMRAEVFVNGATLRGQLAAGGLLA
ncbi:HAD family hydrolase [Actinopolymorpha alba]|uniref:HAD family hydrolase n=1 Tax=Actinopolymorpha alba TaxID=533267 RepID=UPI000366C492|nr:HAD family phosphatase [Actinopolymorpha alba]